MTHLKSLTFIFLVASLAACNNPDSNSNLNRDGVNENRSDSTATEVDRRDENATQLDDDKYYPSSSNDQMEAMYKDVGLTPDQITKFKEDFNRKLDAIKTNGRGDHDMQSIQATQDQSMRTVTSDEEYQRYLDWKKAHPVAY